MAGFGMANNPLDDPNKMGQQNNVVQASPPGQAGPLTDLATQAAAPVATAAFTAGTNALAGATTPALATLGTTLGGTAAGASGMAAMAPMLAAAGPFALMALPFLLKYGTNKVPGYNDGSRNVNKYGDDPFAPSGPSFVESQPAASALGGLFNYIPDAYQMSNYLTSLLASQPTPAPNPSELSAAGMLSNTMADSVPPSQNATSEYMNQEFNEAVAYDDLSMFPQERPIASAPMQLGDPGFPSYIPLRRQNLNRGRSKDPQRAGNQFIDQSYRPMAQPMAGPMAIPTVTTDNMMDIGNYEQQLADYRAAGFNYGTSSVKKNTDMSYADGVDSVPSMLTPGEAVIPAPAAQNPDNKPMINAMINEGRAANDMAEMAGPLSGPAQRAQVSSLQAMSMKKKAFEAQEIRKQQAFNQKLALDKQKALMSMQT